MTAETTTCAPWATHADVISDDCDGPCDDVDAYELETGLAIATDLLWRWSAHQWPGVCTDLVRPSARLAGTRTAETFAHVGLAHGFPGWEWNDSWGYCSCSPLHRRPGPSEISLGRFPLDSIVAVKVDGVELVEDVDYRIDDDYWLVRLPGADSTSPKRWPCCQRVDLPDTEPGTFSVDFTYGAAPPPSGVRAAADFGCELARARCTTGDCELPDEVTQLVRQGMTMQLQQLPEPSAKSRLPLSVRWFLDAVNPTGARMPAMVFSPDTARTNRRQRR